MSPETQKRRPSARAILGVGGVLGLAAAATLTLANWTDEATVEGQISTGTFDIEVTPTTLDFDGVEFAPGVTETSEHTLTNESSVDALVDLDIEGFPGGGGNETDWELTVAVDNGPDEDFAVRYSGDPSGGVSGIELDGGPGGAEDLVLEPGESVEFEITLGLDDEGDEDQGVELDNIEFNFNGTSDTDG